MHKQRLAAGLAALPILASAWMASGYLQAAPAKPAAGIVAKPIPPGYGFPTPKATIDGWIAAGNASAIRAHAWGIWAGMTAASGQIYQGKNLPIWDTWFGSEELFPAPGTTNSASLVALGAARVQPTHKFIQPHQFTHDKKLLLAAAALLGPVDTRVVSFNKFDPAAAGFILASHPGPNAKSYQYNTLAGLNALNNAWPTSTPGQQRGIVDFPDTGIETKPVFSLVKAAGLTPLPLWQGPGGATNANNPTPNTWKTCVLIDPKGTGPIVPATAAQIAAANKAPGLACKTYLYGPLSLLYNFVLTAADATAFNNAQGGHAVAGDFAVLSAMHVNTKEITNWTWQTFYWQPGADTPNGFPGSKAAQPANVVSPWNNYAMCTAYSQVVQPGSSKMTVCFNPYLETSPGIPAGLTSNCMSCHGVAVVNASNSPYPAAYKSPIDFFHNPTYFNKTTTHTDFSWAVPDDAQ